MTKKKKGKYKINDAITDKLTESVCFNPSECTRELIDRNEVAPNPWNQPRGSVRER
jgi:hypothetical protein